MTQASGNRRRDGARFERKGDEADAKDGGGDFVDDAQNTNLVMVLLPLTPFTV